MKRIASVFLFLFCSVLQAQPPRSYTSSEILLQLKKLNTVGSVLYIAAHPDDENTRLIAYLANEKCLRTGYLSLTRGDGGQNLIGPEQGVELGVIRTQELLAARRIDGGEQFFTRAYDFGYSKTPEETFKKWNKDSVLSDVVWVIRNFRPDIIITRFATDGSGGHGHHTASAILAEEAFDAAGDPKRFPEQLQHIEVWQPRRLFYNATNRFRDPNADMSAFIKLDVGGYNPLLGKNYGEIAAESRSMHKSQGFGSAKQRGEYFEYFKPVKGDTAGLKDIFEGIDFTWKRVNRGEGIGESIDDLIKNYNPAYNAEFFRNLKRFSDGFNLRKDLILKDELNYHFKILDNILIAYYGIFYESTTNHQYVSIDDTISFQTILINRSNETIIKDKEGNDEFIGRYGDSTVELKTNIPFTRKAKYKIDKKQHQSQGLFWLEQPIKNNLFDYDFFSSSGQGSFPKYLTTNVLEFPGKGSLFISSYLQFKWVDPEKGELYRPLVITPPVMVNVVNEVVAFPTNEAKEVKVVVKAGKDSLMGEVMLNIPDSWKCIPASASYELRKKGEEKTFTFMVTPPATQAEVTITASVSYGGQNYSKGIKEIKYDHIPIQTLFPEAEIKLIRLDVKKKLKRIGYIPGAGDEVAPCLTQLGYEVITLTDDLLAKENLNQFEAILTGVRAYNTNEKLPAFKQKLMDYVANGGNLIVQYNTNSWAGPLSSDIGPYKFKITRERITDEEAKVNFELPNHPVLNTPNKITDKDFEGWIQERSIYHAGDWDSNYVAPLSMADPGEKNNKGALIIAKHGKGHFVYSGLVFFRQLPAGVPGAYRLLVNMIELGK
ncbi:MAG TPA: PIG-L family deacetylase [Bacteroidia bacterium]|nr:PIG-L family deacetylase [Bacteroidia bacterium]